MSTWFITCKQTYCSLDPCCCGGSLSGRPTMPAPHAATSRLISDPNWGIHIAILRDICACLTAANKSFMQWDNFGWSLRGQTWTNLCWSLCLRYVEVCCTFLSYYWTCEIFGPRTLSVVLESVDPTILGNLATCYRVECFVATGFKLLQFSRLLNSLSEWSMTLMMSVELHRVSKWKWRPLTEL